MLYNIVYNSILWKSMKKVWKKMSKSLEDMFKSTTFAPAFERERRLKHWNDDSWKNSGEYLERIKKRIYLCGHVRKLNARTIFEDIYIIRQVVQETESSISMSTVNREDLGLRWETESGLRIKRKQFEQRRVWSWLRMNASDRLNTCKSRGSTM